MSCLVTEEFETHRRPSFLFQVRGEGLMAERFGLFCGRDVIDDASWEILYRKLTFKKGK